MLLSAIRKSEEEEEQALQEIIYREGKHAAEDDNNMDATPLRLIDVEATIRNRNAGGIIFTRHRRWHVISHTWSADVRELSSIIGKRLATTASMRTSGGDDFPDSQAHCSYEQLFGAAGFDKESSYKKLVEFLIILRSDEVRWVWFDAVCINQKDKEEKEREIQQMGMYYERSVGCHVVHHGIGRGFEVLLRGSSEGDNGKEEEEEGVLPRWFSRAWTFQEWILPPKTTFVVDLQSEQSLARTAHAILLDEYEREESCSCCYFETSLSPFHVKNCMMQRPYDATAADEGSVKLEIREDDADLASFPRNRTRRCCRPSIKEPHFRNIPDRRNWYFVDDLGFAFLVRVKLQMEKVVDDSCNPSQTMEKEIALRDEEYELTRRLEIKGYFRGDSYYSITKEKKIRLTIEEMQVRNCSNEEDRVLSVLKLLGVEGVIQVRSKKSLKEQVIHLARACLQQRDDAMVLQLCLVDGFGNETREMSWAPQFEVKKGSWQEGAQLHEIAGTRFAVAADHFENFKVGGQVRELSREGGLRLATSVCLGHLVCCEHQYTAKVNPRCTTAGSESFRRMVLQVDRETLVYLCARITSASSAAAIADPGAISRDEYACVLEIVGVETSMHGSACIAFPVPANENMSPQDCLHHLRKRIPVWLVRMGLGMHGSSSVTYFLVCVGEQALEGPLHKIGYVGISSTGQSLALLANKATVCYVGGIERTRLHERLFLMANDGWICRNFSNCCSTM